MAAFEQVAFVGKMIAGFKLMLKNRIRVLRVFAKSFLRAGLSISGISCLTRSALVLRLVSANPLKTLICRHICGVTDHVSIPIVLVFLCHMC